MPIPLIKPNPPHPDQWVPYLKESYEKSHFCNFGPAHVTFQRELQQRLNLKHKPVLTCNATLALEVALQAANLTDCDILVPSFTFAATALAVEKVGSRPILVDSEADTWHMSVESAAARITKHTKAIIVVHPLGMLVDPKPYIDFAAANKLLLIFDSAAVFGAQYPEFINTKSPHCDETGLCEILSFHVTKSLGIGEGGAIVSGDEHFLEKCRRLTNFGFNDDAEVELLGTNAKMSDFQAAIGSAVLVNAPYVLASRRTLALEYLRLLDDCWNISFQCVKEEIQQHTFPFFPIKYHGDPNDLVAALKQHEIGYRQYYKPLHLHPRYANKKRNKKKHFPICNTLAEQVFCLPCHSLLTTEEVQKICEVVKSAGV